VTPAFPSAAESLLAFWRDAGVEDCFEDAPQNRLTESERHRRHAAPPPGAPVRLQTPSPVAPDLAEAVIAAREAALGVDSLEALAEAVAAFRGAALRELGARRTVFMRGAAEAEVMVIGEAPGGEEDAQGMPFVGRSGRLLDKALAAAGLDGRVLITNTVFWRPPGDRNPSHAEQAVCAPFLDRLIGLTRPKAMLLLGAAAAKSVLKQDGGILSLRGRWFEHVTDDGVHRTPAMPTLHPAFLLRQPQAKKLAWADLLAVQARLRTAAEVDG
jgi:DNA polymerase